MPSDTTAPRHSPVRSLCTPWMRAACSDIAERVEHAARLAELRGEVKGFMQDMADNVRRMKLFLHSGERDGAERLAEKTMRDLTVARSRLRSQMLAMGEKSMLRELERAVDAAFGGWIVADEVFIDGVGTKLVDGYFATRPAPSPRRQLYDVVVRQMPRRARARRSHRVGAAVAKSSSGDSGDPDPEPPTTRPTATIGGGP